MWIELNLNDVSIAKYSIISRQTMFIQYGAELSGAK